ncbi:unnamed protein product [Rotaria socialis]|uniref:Uncharacterized protein n=2 Tax=Rotaria socialis TaxID=392032 RepID=A0A820TNQ6_9BILA|nr:unnamed protein product [Rotaria socialis]
MPNESTCNLDEQILTLCGNEQVYQGDVTVHDENVDYRYDSYVAEEQQSVELPVVEGNQNSANEIENHGTDESPIIGYVDEPPLPLVDACAPLVDILYNLSFCVNMAIDESATIRLYTIKWKYCSREELQPYFKDLNAEFPPGTPIMWWAFSSTTTELVVLENNMYLGTTDARTLLFVEAINGRTVRAHSHFATEDEILLLPGTHMIVQSQFSPASDLRIIHLKQVVPEETLLEPPFQGTLNIFDLFIELQFPLLLGARLYPKIKLSVINAFSSAGFPSVAFTNPFQFSAGSQIGSSPISLVYGYSNHDRNVDFAILNFEDNSVDVLMGSGNGAYDVPTTSDTGFDSVFVALSNGKGKTTTDLFVINKQDGTISAIFTNGDGTIQFNMDYAVGNGPLFAICEDFNNDTIIDVSVVNGLDNNLVILLSDKGESFEYKNRYPVSTEPIDLISDDFNKDSKVDLILVNHVDNTISILIGGGDGTFPEYGIYGVGQQPNSVVSGDFNNDTKLDLTVANSGNTSISILFGYENGSFHNEVTYEFGNGSNSLVAADLNNDNILDIVVTGSNGHYVNILFGNRNGSFQSPNKYQVGVKPTDVIAADFNNDSRLDLGLTNTGENTISILINYGNGTYKPQVKYVTGQMPMSLVSGSFSNKSNSDLIVVNYEGSNLILMVGNGDGTFQARIPFTLSTTASHMAAGDFNNDNT